MVISAWNEQTDMHHRCSERSKSAPTINSKTESVTASANNSSKRHEEDHLCAWSDVDHPTPCYRYNDVQAKATQNYNVRKSNSYSNARLKPSTKRWNNIMRNNSREKIDNYVFKHFTDCSRYMVDYRDEKIKRLRKNACIDEDQFFQSPTPSNNVDIDDVTVSERRDIISLQSPKDGETLALGYRVEGNKHKSLKQVVPSHQKEYYSRPMRVHGGKCLDCQTTDVNKSPNTRSYTLKTNICALPKCEPFYIPSKTPPLKKHEQFLHPEHVLHGKKLTEFSVSNNSYHSKTFAQKAWRPQPIKTREKVRSAQERDRKENKASSYNNYTNIIKRVLEHYDPSHNSVRNPVNKTNDLKSSFVLASL